MVNIGAYSDNIHPQQYMTGKGDRKGIINHIDLDTLYPCKENCCHKDRLIDPRFCTYENVLTVNCMVIAQLTNIPNLNCSVPASTGGAATTTPKRRINATRAVEECVRRGNPRPTNEEFKPHIYWRPPNQTFQNSKSIYLLNEEKARPTIPGEESSMILGCDEIAQLEVVDTVGISGTKVALEVKLPWGGRAALKRCRKWKCVKDMRLQKEAEMIRHIQEKYGDKVTQYFGECDAPYYNVTLDNHKDLDYQLKNNMQNFSFGYTSVIELGDPFDHCSAVPGNLSSVQSSFCSYI